MPLLWMLGDRVQELQERYGGKHCWTSTMTLVLLQSQPPSAYFFFSLQIEMLADTTGQLTKVSFFPDSSLHVHYLIVLFGLNMCASVYTEYFNY